MEVLRYGYLIPFLCDPPLSKVPISLPSYHPLSTKGVALGEVTQALIAKSAVELAPLPSLGFYSRLLSSVEDLGVLETRHRSLDPQSVVDVSHFRMETIQSVLLSSSGRLDGLHRPQGSLPAGPCPSALLLLPSVCGTGQSVSVLCSLLWPLHSSTGLLTGHGCCFRHSPFLGYPHEAVPRRLARPVVFSRISPSRPSSGPRPLPQARDCSEPREPSQVVQYLGVVIDTRSFRASPSPRVTRLQSTAGEFLSCSDPPASTWLSLLGMLSSLSHLVPGGRLRMRSLQLSPQVLGSRGPVDQDPLASGLPQGSSVVAPPSPSVFRGVSGVSLSRSGLLIRRLRRGLGSSLWFTRRFRPLESRSRLSLYKRPRTYSHPRGSPPLPIFSGGEECVRLLRQQHSSVVSPQGRGHQVSVPQLSDSGFCVGPNPSRSVCCPSSSRGP